MLVDKAEHVPAPFQILDVARWSMFLTSCLRSWNGPGWHGHADALFDELDKVMPWLPHAEKDEGEHLLQAFSISTCVSFCRVEVIHDCSTKGVVGRLIALNEIDGRLDKEWLDSAHEAGSHGIICRVLCRESNTKVNKVDFVLRQGATYQRHKEKKRGGKK